MQLSQPIKDLLASRQPPFPWHERWDSTNIVRILVAEELLAGTIEADTIIVNNNFLGPVVFIGPDPPPDPKPGQLWWRNDPDGVLYVWYDDGNSAQWVPCTPVPNSEPGVGGPSLWADDPIGNVLLPVSAARGILWAGPTSKSRLTWSATPFASQWRVNVNAAGQMDDPTKPALWASIEPTAAQSRIAFYWSPAGASVGVIGMPFSFNMVTGTMDIHAFIGDAIQMGGQSVKGRLITGEEVADRGIVGLRSNRTYRDFVDDPAAPSWKLNMGGPVGVYDTFDIARSPNGTTAVWTSLLHLDSTGKLTIGADPVNPLDVATKRYVDSAAGLWRREFPPGGGGNLVVTDADIGGIRVAPLSRGHGYLGLSMGPIPGDPAGPGAEDMEVYLHGDPTALTIQSGGGRVNIPGVNERGHSVLWIQNQAEIFIEGTWGGCVKLPALVDPDGERLVVVGGVTIGAALRVNEGTMQYLDGHFQGRNGTEWVYLDETGGGGGPQYYLLAGGGAGQPPAGAAIARYVAALAFTLPTGLTGSQGRIKVASTAPAVFSISVNGFIKGYMEFAVGSLVAGFTWLTGVVVAVGDVIEIVAPTPLDATLSDPTWTLRGVL